MKKILVLLSLLFLTVFAIEAKEYTYSQKIKGIDCTLTVNITEESGVRTIFAVDDHFLVENTTKAKIGGGVSEWYLKDPKNDSDVKAVREGNKIFVSGKFKGQDITKEHNVDDRSWYQLFSWELDYLALSNEKRLEFWALRPENPESAGILVAYKDKEERLTLNGEEFDAIKVKVTLGGLLSIFWTGDYWYRKSDGFYVRSKPTGDVLVELNK